MKQPNDVFNDFQAKLSELLKNSPAKDVERNVKAMLSQGFSKLDLVTREEFDTQTQVLVRTRTRPRGTGAACGATGSEAWRRDRSGLPGLRRLEVSRVIGQASREALLIRRQADFPDAGCGRNSCRLPWYAAARPLLGAHLR